MIKGFRNIPELEIELGKMTGLLSCNSYGKSNVLKAIEFGFDFFCMPKNEKDNMMGWKPGFPLNVYSHQKMFSFEIELSLEVEQVSYDIIYGYTFPWRMNESANVEILEEHLKIREVGAKQQYSGYIMRNKGNATYKTSITGRCNKSISVENNELLINKLEAYDELFYHCVINQLNKIEIYIDRHLDAKDAFSPDFIIKSNSNYLNLATTDNIPRTLFYLEKLYPDRYRYLEDIYQQLFPKVEKLHIKEIKLQTGEIDIEIPEDYEFTDKAYLLYCKEKHMSTAIGFSHMSDGARRILLLLTNLILADIHHIPLVCLEEPENSIHPGLLQEYVEVLNDICGSTKVLMTSHSPYLVNYLNPQNIYVGGFNEYDLVSFKKIRKSAMSKLYRDANEMGVNYGDYLFDLMSNPQSSKEVETYVKKR